MSVERPLPVPKTAVPLGISDPVEKARAELKATLAAIEVKANVPRRLGHAVDKTVARARDFQRTNPVGAAAAVVAVAATVGGLVWLAVRAYTR
ncbi:DUF3618 domain-containing protein [Microbacterium sp. 10M-3C3]|uniref:DUF3618 domain-containing protein n=1 Tax=Microbacterium sp. 10M-3C3 TaxID=2483401 RepID=UPI000F63F58C|nr:DUF3618 domain-containing protein [Microbacterium sp. 10M-3C3]